MAQGHEGVSRENELLFFNILISMSWQQGKSPGLSFAECPNTRFPLPVLLYAGYSVKHIP